jgi:photosystem II stability/assembly factor-like uncharacterized protein
MLKPLRAQLHASRLSARRQRDALILALFGVAGLAQAADGAPAAPAPASAAPSTQAALPSPFASQSLLQAATRAGKRIVAVGDQGIVVYSDDEGKTFRQARQVPVRTMLNAVQFIDHLRGWAVGHRGVVLATTDGGETWALQRQDLNADQPLFSVYFKDKQEGWACGLWSLLLHTQDGGQHWTPVELSGPNGKRADRNLYSLFASPKGQLYVAAEQGKVLRSSDGGKTWETLDTGSRASFWTGLGLADGSLLIGGLRGALYRSTDGGEHWNALESHTLSSITSLVQSPKAILATALDGVTLSSADGQHFESQQRPDRQTLTALVPRENGSPLLFSRAGVLPEPAREGR